MPNKNNPIAMGKFPVKKAKNPQNHRNKGINLSLKLVDLRGIEPRTPVCKTGVFPLALEARINYLSSITDHLIKSNYF